MESSKWGTGLSSSGKSRPDVSTGIMSALGSEFSEPELLALGRLGTLIQVAAGSELVIEGRIGNETFVVVAGSARVSRGDETLATLGTGSVLGETAITNSEPRDASVVATTALSVFVMNPAELSSLMAECPRIDRVIKEANARRRTGR